MSDGFNSAAELLPADLRCAAMDICQTRRSSVEEFRLRSGREPTMLLPEGEKVLCRGRRVCAEDMARVLERATSSSLHSVLSELRRGFITARGGVRIGVCGTAAGDEVKSLRSISSLSVRIPRQVKGAGGELTCRLGIGEESVLVISPPGGGKTTFLRELVRYTSEGGKRVSLADERGEVAAVWEGEPQFDVGRCTDVISGAPKAAAAMMLLRSMNPQVIALDEITAPEDVQAMESIANCGVRIYATAHARDLCELAERSIYRKLLSMGIFGRAVIISCTGGRRIYTEAVL